eukprot:CAMPEP_0182484044 /NCGR_PEP_ID=MMETSP1319-20130603/42643_1 /TAXON_ID=172717 /ORGANISM="Bolidomonas pacifica, Strain RCC208" /LENGTH=75 /DNA_ID=CAMNT_0024685909 /DNA_START=143 /DNA_END=367 /DNA_ORIENTATION=+
MKALPMNALPMNALPMLKPWWTPRLRQQTDAKALQQLLHVHAAAPAPLFVLLYSGADGEAEFGKGLCTAATMTPD